MTNLREAAQQALTILEAWKHKGMWGDFDNLTGALKAALVEDAMQKFTDVNQELEAALAEPVLQTCNCRWDGEVQVQQCTLHEAHVDAIHEWAERAKTAEKKLAALAEPEGGGNLPPPLPGDFDHAIGADRFKVRKPEPNSDYERGFVDGMSEQARRSVDKAVNAMIKCKPLAEEEIARLVTNDMVKFARAVERAHGIGGNDE